MGSSNSYRDAPTFGRLSDLYLAKVRAGEKPSVDAFAAAYPALADENRANFPALLLLERTLGYATPTKTLTCGMSVNGYVIEEEIGRGAMGIVYRAYEPAYDRRVALKIIPVGLDGGDIVQRFELERRATPRLTHPNIVPVFDYGHNEEFAYLAMKFIEGTSLDRLLHEQNDHRARFMFAELRSDWQLFARIASQIASGLQHMHNLGLVHRDIKPANLILDGNHSPWITDFGLAKIHDYSRTVSHTGDAVGTPHYMAPEQLRGQCDARSDIYSLGITLYELAAGRRLWTTDAGRTGDSPCASPSPEDLQNENPDVPDELAKIIVKSCEFSPESRYQTCRELQIVLDRFAQGHKKADRRDAMRDSDEIFRKKQKRMYAIVAAAAVGMFVLATGWLAYRRAHQAELAAAQAKDQEAQIASARKSPTFVELMAEADEENLPQVIHGSVRGSVEESRDVLHLNDRETDKILEQVDHVPRQMMSHSPEHPRLLRETKPVSVDDAPQTEPPRRAIQRLPKNNSSSSENARPSESKNVRPSDPAEVDAERAREMRKIRSAHQGTTVSTAASIIGLVRTVERSRLSTTEKNQAFRDIQLLAKLVVNRQINEGEAKSMVAELKKRSSSPDTSQSGNLVIAEAYLRDWLRRLHQRLAQVPNAEKVPLELDRETQDFLHHALP